MNKESVGYIGVALAVAATVAFSVFFFLGNSRPPKQDGKPAVVATIPPLAMVIREIAGDRIHVTSILESGDSPHTFAFTPSKRASVEDAAALFSVGEGLDNWANDVGGEDHTVLFSKLDHRFMMESDPDHVHEDGDGHDHADHDHDPHFWLSIEAVRNILPTIVKVLIKIDPEGENEFKGNAEKFDLELRNLREELAKTLEPVAGYAFVQHHASFSYFLKEHGILNGGTVLVNPEAQVSPKHKAAILAKLKQKSALGIFLEPQFDPKHATEIAEKSGVALVSIDPLGGDEGRETYVELLRYNAKQILAAAPKDDE